MKEEILDAIEVIERQGQMLNAEQRAFLYGKFRQPFRFRYAEGHLGYIFSMSEHEYAKMEHYLGWAYERMHRELLIKHNGQVIVVYGYGERITEVMDALIQLEKESV